MQVLDGGTWMLNEAAKSLWHPTNGGVVAADVAQRV
jgi:hypothetical protein